MAFASRAVSKRGIRDRLAITLWGNREQPPTGPAFTAVTATDSLTFSDSAAGTAQAFTRTTSDALTFAETPTRAATVATRTASETLGFSDSAARAAQAFTRTASDSLSFRRDPDSSGGAPDPHHLRRPHLRRHRRRRQDLRPQRHGDAHFLRDRQPGSGPAHQDRL
jgi:hypothetical protein